jgi:hypothetical protein
VLDQGVNEFSIVQEIQTDTDGVHVIGRPDEFASTSAAVYDVAIRQDAVVAMMAPAPVIPPEALRNAITTCVGANREQAR